VKATATQRQQAQHLAAQLGLADWKDVTPLVKAGVTDRADLTDWTAADIRALRMVGALRASRLVTAIRGAGVYLPDDGYPRDLPSALRTH
jgi:hypothetical protein